MSYVVIDEDGNARDLATNAGLERLVLELLVKSKDATASSALESFLETGTATAEEVARIVAQAPTEGEWAYLRDLFSSLSGDVVLSNGVVEEEEGEQRFAVDDEGYEGRWVTMNGRHVFIREGEGLDSALQRSLKPEKAGQASGYARQSASGNLAEKLNEEWSKQHPKESTGPFWDTAGEQNGRYHVVRDRDGKLVAGATTVQRGVRTEVLSIASHAPGAGKQILNELKAKNVWLVAMASSDKSRVWFKSQGFVDEKDPARSKDWNVTWKRR